MSKLINNIRFKFECLARKKYFNEIYVLIFAIITVLGWKFNAMAGLIIMLYALVFVIALLNDLKYAIPIVIYFLFNINFGFKNDEYPIALVALVATVVLAFIYYIIKNGIKIGKLRSFIGLFGLAIIQLIPIFWTAITTEKALYIMYFCNFLYLLAYIIFASGIKKDSIDILAVTMSYLGVVLACESILQSTYEYFHVYNQTRNILDIWFWLGWGLCNEAGIMICVSIPFSFYLISKSTQARNMFLHNIKIVLSVIGVILTNSRGSYIFVFAEIVILYPITFILSKYKFKYLCFIVYFLATAMITIAILGNNFLKFYDDVAERVFYNHLDDNGRVYLWNRAFSLFTLNKRNMLFGGGMVGEIGDISSAGGSSKGMVVYHSTFYETLAMGGMFGFVFLLLHFTNKYTGLINVNKNFFIIIGIGMLLTDAYGMIDNTYYMYYYMIPLMVILAAIDSSSYDKTNIDWNKLKSHSC